MGLAGETFGYIVDGEVDLHGNLYKGVQTFRFA